MMKSIHKQQIFENITKFKHLRTITPVQNASSFRLPSKTVKIKVQKDYEVVSKSFRTEFITKLIIIIIIIIIINIV
jgi:hypothetical protein